jgi:hypothetical protein
VRRNVERWINAIRERRGWSADFFFALAPDSNINSGSSVNEVTLGGMPFALDDNAKEQSGVGVVMGLQGTRILGFGSDRVKGRLSGAVSTRAYTETSDYNDTTVDLRAGPLFMFRNGEVAVELLSTGRWYGQRDLYDGFGVGVTGRTRVGKRFFVTGLVEARELNWDDDYPGRSGQVYKTGLDVQTYLTQSRLFRLGVEFGRDDAENDVYDFDSIGLSAGIFQDFPWAISAGISGRVLFTRFKEPAPLFDADREDTLTEVSLSALKSNWVAIGFVPRLAVTWADNSSTIDFYSFERMRYEFEFVRRF